MKKKMTISEFEQWSKLAADLREQVLAEKISFEEYVVAIKK